MTEEKLVFTDDEGQEESLFILARTKLGENDYLLVKESEEAEEAFILKLTEESGDDLIFDVVDDDDELEALAGIFEQLLDDENEGEA